MAGLDPARRLAVLAALGPGRPLERHRLVRVRGDGALATRTVRLTDGVAAVMRGEATLDPTIAAAAISRVEKLVLSATSRMLREMAFISMSEAWVTALIE